MIGLAAAMDGSYGRKSGSGRGLRRSKMVIGNTLPENVNLERESNYLKNIDTDIHSIPKREGTQNFDMLAF